MRKIIFRQSIASLLKSNVYVWYRKKSDNKIGDIYF